MFQDSKHIQVLLLAMCFALSEGNLVVCLLRPSKMSSLGTFLEVQWLRRRAASAGGAGLKPHMLRGHLKKKKCYLLT